MVGSHGAVVSMALKTHQQSLKFSNTPKCSCWSFATTIGFLRECSRIFISALERKRNIFASRLTLPRESQRFNTIRLDVMDLTERIDNAIKFVSDIYYARIYRLAATRMGVEDYRKLVDQKLDTFGELYDSMVDRFNETRSFVLEVLVTILAVLDVIFLFRGR